MREMPKSKIFLPTLADKICEKLPQYGCYLLGETDDNARLCFKYSEDSYGFEFAFGRNRPEIFNGEFIVWGLERIEEIHKGFSIAVYQLAIAEGTLLSEAVATSLFECLVRP